VRFLEFLVRKNWRHNITEPHACQNISSARQGGFSTLSSDQSEFWGQPPKFCSELAACQKGAAPNAGWSYGILADGTLYVSGMAGEDAAGKIPGTFEAEMNQTLDNIGDVLKEAGMTPADVVSVQVYLTDAALFDRMNNVYKARVKDPKPARTTVVVSKLVGLGHVEITVTAKK